MRTGLVSDDAGVRYSFRQPVQRSVVQAWNTSTYTGAGLARWGETIYFATLLPSSGGAVDVQLWSSGSNGLSFTPLWRERVCDSCGQPPPAGASRAELDNSRLRATLVLSEGAAQGGLSAAVLVDAGGAAYLLRRNVAA